jgi:CHAD domain-containing protein
MFTLPEGFESSLSAEDVGSIERLAKQEAGMHRRDGDAGHHSPRLPLTEKAGIQPDDLMSEAGRKILAYFFARMLAEEEGVRQGAAVDPIHDMRVATRRLRSALDTFEAYYHYKAIKPYVKMLRKVGRALGAVRDLDVFRLKADKYAEGLPDDRRRGLQGLLDDWRSQLDDARQTLIEVLDGDSYTEFVAEFAHFVTTPDKDAIKIPHKERSMPHQVRHVAPRLIYQRYEVVRAYETVLGEASLGALHLLRIDAKRLRYMLESFAEVLGPEAKTVIESVKMVQDHLGELQDARVAVMLMSDFVHDAGEETQTSAVLQYMAVREEEKQRLLAAVPQVWQAFTHPDIRRALALSVAVL